MCLYVTQINIKIQISIRIWYLYSLHSPCGKLFMVLSVSVIRAVEERRLAVAFCLSSTCELSEAVANIVHTHHQSASYSSMLFVGGGEDSVTHTHPTLTKRWNSCWRQVPTPLIFVGNTFYTVYWKASSSGTSSNMLVRMFCTTWPMASPTGGASSRTSSFHCSFRNVFMLSPEQRMIQHVEIVATNIPTLAIILLSIILLF